jgi:hypothetical protein
MLIIWEDICHHSMLRFVLESKRGSSLCQRRMKGWMLSPCTHLPHEEVLLSVTDTNLRNSDRWVQFSWRCSMFFVSVS